jgi:hypothetical protein
VDAMLQGYEKIVEQGRRKGVDFLSVSIRTQEQELIASFGVRSSGAPYYRHMATVPAQIIRNQDLVDDPQFRAKKPLWVRFNGMAGAGVQATLSTSGFTHAENVTKAIAAAKTLEDTYKQGRCRPIP